MTGPPLNPFEAAAIRVLQRLQDRTASPAGE